MLRPAVSVQVALDRELLPADAALEGLEPRVCSLVLEPFAEALPFSTFAESALVADLLGMGDGVPFKVPLVAELARAFGHCAGIVLLRSGAVEASNVLLHGLAGLEARRAVPTGKWPKIKLFTRHDQRSESTYVRSKMDDELA